MWTLEVKVALVTGGGKGIGRAVALALSARGVRVVVTGREERALGETVGEIAHGGGKGRHVVGDVRDPAHLEAAVARAIDVFGGLDIVVANAAQTAEEAGFAAAESVLRTNLIGAYATFDAALKRMQGPGHLLATIRTGGRRPAAQAASEGGLRGLCAALALELAPRQIECGVFVADRAAEPEEAAARAVALCSAPRPVAAAHL